MSGELTAIFDTRTTAGTEAVFGGEYPSSVIYVSPAFAETKSEHRTGDRDRHRAHVALDRQGDTGRNRQGDAAGISGKDPALYAEIVKRSKAM